MTENIEPVLAQKTDYKKLSFIDQEISPILKFHNLWLLLAWQEIKLRYKRTLLGPLWVSMAMFILILSVSLIYSQLFGRKINEYVPFLSLGIVAWVFVSTVVVESCSLFHDYAGYIKQIKVPHAAFVLRMLMKNIIIFLHNFPLVILVLLGFNKVPSISTLMIFLAGLFVVILNLMWASLLMSLLAARYRDVQHFVATIMQPIFFVTPIIWDQSGVKSKRFIIDYNPFYYMVELVRGPFMGSDMTYIILYGFLFGLGGMVLSLYVLSRTYKKVVLWL